MWFEAPGARFVKLLELLNITVFSSSYTTLQVYATEYMGICLIFGRVNGIPNISLLKISHNSNTDVNKCKIQSHHFTN
jgi:hypothetical protein